MSINKLTATNIDNSDPVNFPNGRIKDNSGIGDGTPVNRFIYSDIHEYFAKLMRLAGIAYNNLPDSTTNGYQLVDAAIALAGKNDFITPLNTIVVVITGVNTNVISVPLKFSTLNIGEALVCQASFDQTDQTLIQGTEAALYPASLPNPHPFKNGDYIRFIKTNTGATLVRLADDLNINQLATELLFLKATTEADEYTGTTQAAATTPYTNQLAFFRRVCGLDSGTFLASVSRNGLLSKEQWAVINGIASNPVRNTGWFSGVSPGGGTVGSAAPRSGDVVSAIIQNVVFGAGVLSGGTSSVTYTVTLANAMTGTNYFVRTMIRSEGTLEFDNDVLSPVFRIIDNTTFLWSINNIGNGQNLKIHIEAVQIS